MPRVTWAGWGRAVHVRRSALLAVVVLAGVLPSASASAAGLGSPLQSFVAAAETAKAPKITKQPAGVTVEEGQNGTFTAVASGTPTPTAQWELSSNGGASWSAIEGATSAALTIVAATTSESGELLRAVFRNAAGEAVTSAVSLTVRSPPAVTRQPAGETVEAGQGVTF